VLLISGLGGRRRVALPGARPLAALSRHHLRKSPGGRTARLSGRGEDM